MRLIRHPLVNRDLTALVDHIVETTQGDFDAASRRLDEIDNLLVDILENPFSGMRLAAPLDSNIRRSFRCMRPARQKTTFGRLRRVTRLSELPHRLLIRLLFTQIIHI